MRKYRKKVDVRVWQRCRIFQKIKNFPELFFEENPVFIFQLKEALVGGGGLDERIC
jgi:hypothetical protein